MTIEEIHTALGELVAAMVEKGVPSPRAELTVKPAGERNYIYLKAEYRWRGFDGDDAKFCRADTVSECIDNARSYIAALPSPKEAVTREYLTRVASAIDYATENSIADGYVTPLRTVTCAMTENLLTKENDT